MQTKVRRALMNVAHGGGTTCTWLSITLLLLIDTKSHNQEVDDSTSGHQAYPGLSGCFWLSTQNGGMIGQRSVVSLLSCSLILDCVAKCPRNTLPSLAPTLFLSFSCHALGSHDLPIDRCRIRALVRTWSVNPPRRSIARELPVARICEKTNSC